MTIKSIREQIKEVRSNNHSLASLLDSGSIDVLVTLIEGEVRAGKIDEAQYWQSRIIDIDKGFVTLDFAKAAGYERLKKLSITTKTVGIVRSTG